jgi:hypothetical protein
VPDDVIPEVMFTGLELPWIGPFQLPLSAYVILSEPDELGDRYAKFYLFVSKIP